MKKEEKKEAVFIDKSKLKGYNQKLHSNFIMVNFFLNRLQKIREKYREALFDMLYDLGYRSNVKIVDKENNTVSHVSYYSYSKDTNVYRPKGRDGEFSQIQTYVYECQKQIVRVKKSKDKLISKEMIRNMFKGVK